MKIMKIMLSDWLAKETGIDKRVIKVRFYNLTKLAYKVVYENKVHYLPMSLTRILSVEDTGSLVFEDKDYEHMLIYVDMDLINTNKYPNIQTISTVFFDKMKRCTCNHNIFRVLLCDITENGYIVKYNDKKFLIPFSDAVITRKPNEAPIGTIEEMSLPSTFAEKIGICGEVQNKRIHFLGSILKEIGKAYLLGVNKSEIMVPKSILWVNKKSNA